MRGFKYSMTDLAYTIYRIHMIEHLYSRRVRSVASIIFSEGCCYFTLYNLSGQIVGYQRYSPTGVKVSKSNETSRKREEVNLNEIKYLTYVSEGQLGVFGLETYRVNEPLFITEGIFDAKMVHEAGFSCIAVLSNDPVHLKSWLRTLPNVKIAILDNDKEGRRLAKYADLSFTSPGYKDLNEMSLDQVKELIKMNGFNS